MSRSQPHLTDPNPATRWHEYDGTNGVVRYYDKEAKKNVIVGDKFAFLYLDETASVTGWHEPSKSGIVSNMIKDSRKERFSVRSFKGGPIVDGFWSAIKAQVTSKAVGGHYTTTIYCATKGDAGLVITALQLKGAALGEWSEFRKANRKDIYTKAVQINGSVSKSKGGIHFKVPVFSILPLKPETDEAAKALDQKLQAYFATYFAKTVDDAVPSKDSPPTDEHYSEPDDASMSQESPEYEPQ